MHLKCDCVNNNLSFPSDDVICDVALLCGRLPAAHYSTGAAVMTNNSLREMLRVCFCGQHETKMSPKNSVR